MNIVQKAGPSKMLQPDGIRFVYRLAEERLDQGNWNIIPE
jgi:hypothetical protein